MRLGCLFSHPANIAVPAQGAVALQRELAGGVAAQAAVARSRRTSKTTSPKCWPRANCSAWAWRSSASPTCPAQANFVLVHFGKRAIEVRDGLREQGILVRDRSYEAARLRPRHRRHARADPPLPGRAGGDLDNDSTAASSSTWTASWWTSPNPTARPSSQTVQHFTGSDDHARSRSRTTRTRAAGTTTGSSAHHIITASRRRRADYETVVDYFQSIFLGDGDDGLILREQWVARPGLLEAPRPSLSSSPSSPDARAGGRTHARTASRAGVVFDP